MAGPERHCQACGSAIETDGPIGRRDSCESCGADLHACIQCRFYDPAASDQCREPQAERVVDKERQNFCEYFQLAAGPGGRSPSRSPAEEAKARLEALFRK